MKFSIHRKKLKIVLTAGIIAVLAGLMIIAIFFLNKSSISKKNDVSYICNNDEIGEAVKPKLTNFGSDEATTLAEVIPKIENIENYQNYPNCLYTLAKYYNVLGNYTAAIPFYEQLLKLNSESNIWIDESIGTESPEDVTKILVFLNDQQQSTGNILKQRPIPPLETQ